MSKGFCTLHWFEDGSDGAMWSDGTYSRCVYDEIETINGRKKIKGRTRNFEIMYIDDKGFCIVDKYVDGKKVVPWELPAIITTHDGRSVTVLEKLSKTKTQ